MIKLEAKDLRPNLAEDFRRVHSVITRGLTIALGQTQTLIDKQDNEVATLDGFLDYLRSLTSFLHAHHLMEDELAFPTFQKKKLDAPYTGLMNDHKKMVKILDDLNPHIQELAQSRQDITVTRHIHLLLQKLYNLWDPHLKIEESHFTQDNIDSRFTPEEQRQMST